MSTHNISFQYNKENLWDFSKGLKNEFETAVVNEPSVFEPLKIYCIWNFLSTLNRMTVGINHFTLTAQQGSIIAP